MGDQNSKGIEQAIWVYTCGPRCTKCTDHPHAYRTIWRCPVFAIVILPPVVSCLLLEAFVLVIGGTKKTPRCKVSNIVILDEVHSVEKFWPVVIGGRVQRATNYQWEYVLDMRTIRVMFFCRCLSPPEQLPHDLSQLTNRSSRSLLVPFMVHHQFTCLLNSANETSSPSWYSYLESPHLRYTKSIYGLFLEGAYCCSTTNRGRVAGVPYTLIMIDQEFRIGLTVGVTVCFGN